MAMFAALAFATRVEAQNILGDGEGLGVCCDVSEVVSGEVSFEISDVVYDPDGGGWYKFPLMAFGPGTEYPNGIPAGTLVSLHETIHISPGSPEIWDWHQELYADSVDYFSGDSTEEENTAEWVVDSATATFNGGDVVADVQYETVPGESSIVWMDFTEGLSGGTLEIWKEFITTADVPLYHPDDTGQTVPGGESYVFIYQYPTVRDVPEPAACTMAWLCGLLVVPWTRRRLRRAQTSGI
jgi:hypothetical protein